MTNIAVPAQWLADVAASAAEWQRDFAPGVVGGMDEGMVAARRLLAQVALEAGALGKGADVALVHLAMAGECPTCDAEFDYITRHMENKHTAQGGG